MIKRENIIKGRAQDQIIISDEDKAIPDRLKKDDIYTKPNLNILSTPVKFYKFFNFFNFYSFSFKNININHQTQHIYHQNSIIKIVS